MLYILLYIYLYSSFGYKRYTLHFLYIYCLLRQFSVYLLLLLLLPPPSPSACSSLQLGCDICARRPDAPNYSLVYFRLLISIPFHSPQTVCY